LRQPAIEGVEAQVAAIGTEDACLLHAGSLACDRCSFVIGESGVTGRFRS
jgi:hypothetical protein